MKNFGVVFTYRYVNSSSSHTGEVVFKGDKLDEESFENLKNKMRDAFFTKSRDSFIASQIGLPDLFDYVPSFENDTCWHKYIGCDISLKKPTDERTFEEFVSDVEKESIEGWQKFDVLEKKTGRIPQAKYVKEIETLSKNYAKELENQNKASNKEIENLTKAHAKEIETIVKNSEKELNNLKKSFDDEIEKIKKGYIKEMETIEARHEKSKVLLKETSECIQNYFDGEATSEELERSGKEIVKMLSSM